MNIAQLSNEVELLFKGNGVDVKLVTDYGTEVVQNVTEIHHMHSNSFRGWETAIESDIRSQGRSMALSTIKELSIIGESAPYEY
jgi:hypothetical protein